MFAKSLKPQFKSGWRHVNFLEKSLIKKSYLGNPGKMDSLKIKDFGVPKILGIFEDSGPRNVLHFLGSLIKKSYFRNEI